MPDWTSPAVTKAFATYIRKFINGYPITQADFADRCRRSKDTICNTLTGKNAPSNTTRTFLFTGIAELLTKKKGLRPEDKLTMIDIQREFENSLQPKGVDCAQKEATGDVTVTDFKEKLPYLLGRNAACNSEEKLANLLSLPMSEEKKCATLEIWKNGSDAIPAGQIPINQYWQIQQSYGLLPIRKQDDIDDTGDKLFRGGSVDKFKQWAKNPIQIQKGNTYINKAGQVFNGDNRNMTNYITM